MKQIFSPNEIKVQAHILKISQAKPKLKKCRTRGCQNKLFIRETIDGKLCFDCWFDKYFEKEQARIDHFF